MESRHSIVEIGGASYCAGLFWYPIETTGGAGPEQIETLLAEQAATQFVTRGKPAFQVGLVGAGDPQVRNLSSIAAIVADRLSKGGLKSFLVAFETDLPGEWCYVAQNQGLLQFDGDMVGDASTVRGRFQVDLSAGVEWQLVVAPRDWDILGAVERSRDELVPAQRLVSLAGSPFRLRPVGRHVSAAGGGAKGWVVAGSVLAMVAEIYGAYHYYDSSTQELEQLRAQAAAEQASFVASRPWFGQSLLADWSRACIDAMIGPASQTAGWGAVTMSCDPAAKTVRVNWSRRDGAVFDDLVSLRDKTALTPSTDEPAAAGESIPVSVPPNDHLPVAPSELLPQNLWRLTATRWNEQWRASRPVFGAVVDGPGIGQISWTVSDSVPPWEVLALLELPGAVLNGIDLSSSNDGKPVWTVKATHYVRK
jgi:hypothetical protein